jgi:hypothetical protein
MFSSTMLPAADIKAAVTQAATDAGFELVGIAPVEDAPELEYFPRWIAEGRAGEMKYLETRDEQGRLKRASLAHAAPWARVFHAGAGRSAGVDLTLCLEPPGLSRRGDAATTAS